MISINKIEVLDLFSTRFLQIKFTVDDTTEDLSSYKFNLFKSNSPTDGFILAASNVQGFSYVDYDVNLYVSSIGYYYKVQIVDKNGSPTMSNVVGSYRGKEPDTIADTIIYNYNTYLQNVVKNKMYLLQRKHNGQFCEDCYDRIRKRAADANCTTCYGTKYVGGYYSPIEIYTSKINAAGKTNDFTVSSDGEDLAAEQLWTSNFPTIRVKDVLVDRNNDRFIVTHWQPTYKDYYLVKQLLQVEKMHESDIVYTFPIE